MFARSLDRFPGTRGSRQAQTLIERRLRDLRLPVRRHYCRVYPHTLLGQAHMDRLVPVVLIYIAAKGLLYLGLVTHATAGPRWLLWVIPVLLLVEYLIFRPRVACNVSTEVTPAEDIERRIILIAHYDAPRVLGMELPVAIFLWLTGRWYWSRSLGRRFASDHRLRIWLSGLGLLAVLVAGAWVFHWAISWSVPIVLATIPWLWLVDWLVSPCPLFAGQTGANDNATGVEALVAVAETLAAGPLRHTSVSIVFTDGEELGGQGMHSWLQENAQDIDAALALDAVGEGRPEAHITESSRLLRSLEPHLWLVVGSAVAENGDLSTVPCADKGAIVGITDHGSIHGHWDDAYDAERWASWEDNIHAVARTTLVWLAALDEECET